MVAAKAPAAKKPKKEPKTTTTTPDKSGVSKGGKKDSGKKSSSSPTKRKSSSGSSTRPAKSQKKSSTSDAATKKGASEVGKATTTTPPQTTTERKHAEAVAQAKLIWNKLREKSNSAEQNRRYMTELWPLIVGKVGELCRKHDAARVVQAALQFGNATERRALLLELCSGSSSSSSDNANSQKQKTSSALVELSKSAYGHFCVLKAIHYMDVLNDASVTNAVLKSFKGHVKSLAGHAVGSRIVEKLYTTLTPSRWTPLQLELYGPHLQMLLLDTAAQQAVLKKKQEQQQQQQRDNPYSSLLHACLQHAPAQHRDAAVAHVLALLHKGMVKQLYAHTYFQALLADYCAVATGRAIRHDLLAGSSGECCHHAIYLLSGTPAGAYVTCAWLNYGTAKDRKSLCKSFKGYARSGLLQNHSHLAFLRVLQLTDDTVLLQKTLLAELLTTTPGANKDDDDKDKQKKSDEKEAEAHDKEMDDDKDVEEDHPLLELALSDCGSKLFLLILLLDQPQAALQKVLDPYEFSVLGGPIPTIEEQNGAMVPTSKKAASQRRAELLQSLQAPLLQLCRQHAGPLLVSRSGSVVLRHVYQYLPAQHDDEWVPALVQAAVNVVPDVIGHWTVKHLLWLDKDRDTKSFSQAFLAQYQKTKSLSLMEVALSGNRGAFVVAALCQVQPQGTAALLHPTKLQKHLDKQDKKKSSPPPKKHNKQDDEEDYEEEVEGDHLAGLRALLKELHK